MKFDVIVIGGGLLGSTIGRKLVLEGASVILIEKHAPGCNEVGVLDSLSVGNYVFESRDLLERILRRVEELEKRSFDLFRKRWTTIIMKPSEVDRLISVFEELNVSFRVEESGLSILDRVTDAYTLTVLNLLDALDRGLELRSFCEVLKLLKEENQVFGVLVYDKRKGEYEEVKGDVIVIATNSWTNVLLQTLGLCVPIRLKKLFTLVFCEETSKIIKLPEVDCSIIPYGPFTVVSKFIGESKIPEESYVDLSSIKELVEVHKKFYGEPPPVLGYAVSQRCFYNSPKALSGGGVHDHDVADEYYGLITAISPRPLLTELVSDEAVRVILEKMGLEPSVGIKPLPTRQRLLKAYEKIPVVKAAFNPFLQNFFP